MNCYFCHSESIVKQGWRKSKQRNTQKYQCTSCKKYFTNQHPKQQSKTYNLKIILDSISNYNLGKPLRSQRIPKSTIHDWIKTINLPMNRLRNKLKTTPKYKIIKKQFFIHHKQPFLYQYHTLKLEFAKKFPGLIEYLTNLNLPKGIFKESQRISQQKQQKPVGKNFEIREKQNYAVQLAKLAASITKDNKQRHNIIENFMLINDTSTIATEIPVYINDLTGHIDILQLRFHKLYILDYKPEPINKQQTINQLKLYREALSKRTNIKKHKFKLAFFNDKSYYEFR